MARARDLYHAEMDVETSRIATGSLIMRAQSVERGERLAGRCQQNIARL